MRSIGIAALVLLGLFLGVFLWLEFTTDVSREFMLSDGDTADLEWPRRPILGPAAEGCYVSHR